jgi:lipoprotein-releasing system permease protein
MPFELFLALRYLYSPRRGRAARVTSAAAILGIACGVAAYILASALAAGFRDEMQDKILRGTAHITVAPVSGAPIVNADFVRRTIEATEGVRHASLTSYTGALLIGETANAYAVVRAVDPTSTHALEELRRTLIAGRIEESFSREAPTSNANGVSTSNADSDAPPVPVIIGAELAAQTGLTIGAAAQIIAAEPALQTGAGLPRSNAARVVGIFRAGLHDYDATWVYAPLAPALSLGVSPGGAQRAPVISVETTDVYRAPETAARLRERLGADWKIVTWAEANQALFAALELERRTIGAIISLVSVIASLNILTTLVLLVGERRRHIAILAALGARGAASSQSSLSKA